MKSISILKIIKQNSTLSNLVKWFLPSTILLLVYSCNMNPVSEYTVNTKSDIVGSVPGGMRNSTITVGKTSYGLLFLFAIGSNNQIYEMKETYIPGWKPFMGTFSSLGDAAFHGAGADVVLATQRGCDMCLFVNNASDNKIKYRRLTVVDPNTWKWSPWVTLNGTGDFQTGNYPDGSLAVFNVQNSKIYCCKETSPGSNSWGAFNPIRPEVLSNCGFGISVGRNSGGNLEIFFTDGPTSIKHTWQNTNGSWSNPYSSIPSNVQVYSRIQVAKAGDGKLVIFSRTFGGSLAYAYQDYNIPGGWTTMSILSAGGSAVSNVNAFTVGTNSDGRLEVFYVDGGTGLMRHTWQSSATSNSTWSAVSDIATTPTFYASAVTAGKSNMVSGLMVFGGDNLNRVNYSYFNGSIWTPFAVIE